MGEAVGDQDSVEVADGEGVVGVDDSVSVSDRVPERESLGVSVGISEMLAVGVFEWVDVRVVDEVAEGMWVFVIEPVGVCVTEEDSDGVLLAVRLLEGVSDAVVVTVGLFERVGGMVAMGVGTGVDAGDGMGLSNGDSTGVLIHVGTGDESGVSRGLCWRDPGMVGSGEDTGEGKRVQGVLPQLPPQSTACSSPF